MYNNIKKTNTKQPYGKVIMTKYYRSVNGKPVEITEQEAKEQEKKNQELFNSGDFSKMMDIEIILKIEK